MKRVAVVVLAWSLACSWPPSPIAPDPEPPPEAPRPAEGGNLGACKAWVAHHNGLDCLDQQLDEATICRAVDRNPHDLVPYYRCLVKHAACTGGKPDIDTATCRLPR